jgi:hypothetical protein
MSSEAWRLNAGEVDGGRLSAVRFESASYGMTNGRPKNRVTILLTVLAAALLVLSSASAADSVIQGHAPSPLVLQGHSPIVLLLTDPLGNQIGCVAVPCKSTTSHNFVDTIPSSEGPAYYFFSNNTIVIAEPILGTWTLQYLGSSGHKPAPFSLSATTCPETNGDDSNPNQGHNEPGCSNLTGILYDPDDSPVASTLLSGTVKMHQVGSISFVFNSDGSITLLS